MVFGKDDGVVLTEYEREVLKALASNTDDRWPPTS
jgi:hypothetical protein